MVDNFSILRSDGGGDYSTLGGWEADTDNDLVTATTKEIALVSGIFFLNASVSLNGATTNAQFHRVLIAHSGEQHIGTSGTGARIQYNAAGAGVSLVFRDDFDALSGLELAASGSDDILSLGNFGNDPSGIRVISNLIFSLDEATNLGDAIRVIDGGTSFSVINNVIWNIFEKGVNITINAAGRWDIIHNTFHNLDLEQAGPGSNAGVRQRNAAANNPSYLLNNLVSLVHGGGSYRIDGSGNVFTSGNASYDSLAPGLGAVHGVSGLTLYTSSVPPYDFSLLSVNDVLNSGVPIDFLVGGLPILSTDVIGSTRPQGTASEIGAYEVIVGAIFQPPDDPLVFHHRTVTETLEHSMSGTFEFKDSTFQIPTLETLPSGIQNQVVWINTSGALCIYHNGAWKVKLGAQ